MFLIPAASAAWRFARAFCWLVAAVLCALVLKGLLSNSPDSAPLPCPCDLCVRREAGE